MEDNLLVRQKWAIKWREYLRSQRLVFLMEEDETLYNSLRKSELFQSSENELKFIFLNAEMKGSIDMSQFDFMIIDFNEEKFSHMKRVIWRDERIYKIIFGFQWLGFRKEMGCTEIDKAKIHLSQKRLGKKSDIRFNEFQDITIHRKVL